MPLTSPRTYPSIWIKQFCWKSDGLCRKTEEKNSGNLFIWIERLYKKLRGIELWLKFGEKGVCKEKIWNDSHWDSKPLPWRRAQSGKTGMTKVFQKDKEGIMKITLKTNEENQFSRSRDSNPRYWGSARHR